MSRITGSEAKSMIEAYSAVYISQELTEEQVWEEVEAWVNSLVEEGYDLSEYTWEEMYESYIEEQGPSTRSPGSVGYKPRMGTETGRQLNTVFGQGNRLLGSAPRQTSVNQRQNLRGGGSRPVTPAAKPPMPGLPPSARQVTQYPAGVSTGVGGGNAGASRPAAPVTRPSAPASARPAAPVARPATTSTQTAKPQPSAAPAAPASTASTNTTRPSLAQQAAELRKMRMASQMRQSGANATGTQLAGFDMFDVVKAHLLDEGYADTEESALVIMANMSEEWRQSIVEKVQIN
jgi:hypothetical protein